ncbi:UBX domain-containing protein 6 [Portunus trituberculatus]|uniref:UBX domain-containing protein 6 n=1 Tax=Portunus trituberculatus TaxID=210409 RepID=A0A5B7CNA8_PORTR|nr:UBX domain-containing protein 6 [Portunus trituberculatus]
MTYNSVRSLQAIKTQARRELEAERAAMEQMKLNEQQEVTGPREVHMDSAPMLAVQGVYFHCPLIGPEVASYEEIKKQIRDFLYSQMEEDRAISSCIIIHTCNKNKEKINTCIETLCKYIENIVSNPTEEKFRKIRISNRAYQERIHPMEGTKEFLEAAGFTVQELPFNDTTDKFWSNGCGAKVRFPDGLILQGTFGVNEKFEEVVKFVRENLVNDWRPFFLNLSGGGKVTEEEQTLVELRLVPAVVFNFEWDFEVQDPNLDDNVFLRPETLSLLQEKA